MYPENKPTGTTIPHEPHEFQYMCFCTLLRSVLATRLKVQCQVQYRHYISPKYPGSSRYLFEVASSVYRAWGII